MFIHLYKVNNRWPFLHLHPPNKHRLLALLLITPNWVLTGGGGVKEWSGLSNYCISSLSSCFLGPNNPRVHKSGLGRRDLYLWMNSHRKKKTEPGQSAFSIHDVRRPLCCCITVRGPKESGCGLGFVSHHVDWFIKGLALLSVALCPHGEKKPQNNETVRQFRCQAVRRRKTWRSNS